MSKSVSHKWELPYEIADYVNHQFQGIKHAIFEISNSFWVHQNWRPNFDELISKKTQTIKPHKLKKCQYK